MKILITLFVVLLMLSPFTSNGQEHFQTKAYKPTWESIISHPTPDWFRDAKFGIYFHWGVYSVPAFGNEWYPRNMYMEGSREFEHHRQDWGPQEQFGYKDFIPLFRAEKFNAEEWVDLFVKAGAQFIGPVAEHHDGFAMWDSELTDWDVKDMGPRRDITGELAEAARKRGLKFMVSLHHARKWRHFDPAFHYDAADPRYAGLYGRPHHENDPEPADYLEQWLGKAMEVMDKYQPDYVWFDYGWREPTFESYKRELLAFYYNKGEEWGKNVVVSYKHDHLPLGAGVLDLERGRLDTLYRDTWITDTSIDRKSWCYIEDPDYKDANTLIDNLVDRVSKNGNTLLNIAPRPDGTIPEEQKELLLAMGEWMRINGEAIYGSRYWYKYGEGPTKFKGGSFIDNQKLVYTSEDIRFTRKDDTLYAILLDWPGEQALIRSLSSLKKENIRSVSLLGNPGDLSWELTDKGLTLIFPEKRPCDYAYTLKITYTGKLPWEYY
jgi:alpha-L-fucosidase